MKKIHLILLFILLPFSLAAQKGSSDKPVDLGEVTVTARRILSDIGIQKTELDSSALRENITNSLAEVLSQNSTIFIKSYGRATLSTASFRGTAPSHTQVTWNDIKINSPMLGMVDFSLIPSYFIDEANLFHGGSSTGVTGGGLGGAITLNTSPAKEDGLNLRYIQGISSFDTYDEFLRVTYGNDKWKSSTRVLYSSSDNDFKYTNYDTKVPIKDGDDNIIGWENPVQRNRNGGFKDLHLLQELYYNAANGSRWGLYAWYTNSERGIPKLSVDKKDDNLTKSQQDENTLRMGASWDKHNENLSLSGKAGYTYTDMKYVYKRGLGNGEMADMINSRSYVNTMFGKFGAQYFLSDKWLFIGDLTANQHFVDSRDRAIKTIGGERRIVGYDKGRIEISGFVSAKYTPTKRLGLAVNLREEYNKDSFSPLIPGFFVDYLVSKKGNIVLKASIAKNHRYPTLNDLYFMPGGNPSLKTEKGYTYDGGAEFMLKNKHMTFKGEISAYNSYINDWILWLRALEGAYMTPVNVKKVRSYGLEGKGKFSARINKKWMLELEGNYAITKSINKGGDSDPDSPYKVGNAIGKQLPYIPEYSSSAIGRLSWKKWTFTYKWIYYSERFTTSSNDTDTRVGRLGAYYMNDISLEKQIGFRWADCSLKVSVNNLFDEEYQSELSRPMAGRNFGIFIGITPRFLK